MVERAAAPGSEGYVTTADGVRLFFHKVGNGRRLVLIPNGLYLIADFEQFSDHRTLVFYDVRNRGRSDHVSDSSQLGIHHDVDDVDAVRRHFGMDRVDLIGHSYIGLMVALYAMKYPEHVDRVVQIGPMEPDARVQYPSHLTNADATLAETLSRLAQLQKEAGPEDPVERCKKFWSILNVIYVTNPADAGRINWGRCDLPNERNFMKPWTEIVLPSIQKLNLTAEDFAQVKAAVLTVHGKKDRSAPYGGGRDWALRLPNARLLTVENGCHGPWIEAPDTVFGAIRTFLDGKWPDAAERVTTLDPTASTCRHHGNAGLQRP